MSEINLVNDSPKTQTESQDNSVRAILVSILLGLSTGGLFIYALVIRPWLQNWGASPAEQAAPLPGDEIVPEPRHIWTRALTIDAPPTAIWPWLVQMGQGRGGLYSYDGLENLIGCDIHSIDYIAPELQNLAVGDEIRLVKPDYPADLALKVARLEPESALVLQAKGDMASALAQGLPYLSWAFVLQPTADGNTRLLVRTRATYATSFADLFWNRYALEPIQFIMERKMMLGIRERACKQVMQTENPTSYATSR